MVADMVYLNGICTFRDMFNRNNAGSLLSYYTMKYPHLVFKIKQKSYYLVISTTIKHAYNEVPERGNFASL